MKTVIPAAVTISNCGIEVEQFTPRGTGTAAAELAVTVRRADGQPYYLDLTPGGSMAFEDERQGQVTFELARLDGTRTAAVTLTGRLLTALQDALDAA